MKAGALLAALLTAGAERVFWRNYERANLPSERSARIQSRSTVAQHKRAALKRRAVRAERKRQRGGRR